MDKDLSRPESRACQAPPTLEEIARSRPKRSAGAPPRTLSHKANLLELLKERGSRGVLASELYNSPEKFGRSPRNRLSELRKEGHLIQGEPRGASDWHYVLVRDASGQKPDSRDWYERQHGPRPRSEQSSQDLGPLFQRARA
jgi:hypothetical protein